MDSKTRKQVIVMSFVTLFLDMFNNGLIIPILPYLIKEYEASAFEEGFLFSSYSIMQMISIDLLSYFINRFMVYGTLW